MKPDELGKILRQKAGEKGKLWGAWFTKHRKEAAMGAAFLVLLAAVVFSIGGNHKQDLEDTVEPVLTTVSSEAVPAPSSETASLAADPVPRLDEDQAALLDGLTEALEEGDFEKGGTLILDNEQKLQYLFYQTLEGRQYLYSGGTLSQELEGKGLVLKKPMSVFYGTFQEGAPEGEGTALQGIVLDGLRYDYSEGNWKDGKLNGQCTVGYHYYNGIQGDENQAVERMGQFANDLMEGSFTYQTTNGDGEVTVWDMDAEDGRTKLDDRWVHDDEKHYYYLPSKEFSSHTYVLPDDQVEEQRWRNMLPWDE